MTTPLRMVLDPIGAELDAALACEAEVFLEAFSNTAEEFDSEYGPYADQTGFMTVLDPHGEAWATTRFIEPGPAGLKTLNDIGRPPWHIDGNRSAAAAGLDLSRTWDIATVAVRRRSERSPLCSAALYHAIVAAARANGITSIVMIMDERPRRLLAASGLEMETLPGTDEGEYLGSPNSTPLWAHLEPLFAAQREANPDAHRLIYQGIGLESIAMPESWRRARPTVAAGA